MCHCRVDFLCQCAQVYCCSIGYHQSTGVTGLIYAITISSEKTSHISHIQIGKNINFLSNWIRSLDLNLQLPNIINYLRLGRSISISLSVSLAQVNTHTIITDGIVTGNLSQIILLHEKLQFWIMPLQVILA